MPDKQWRLKPEPEESACDALSKAININPLLSKLLLQRNIKSFEEAKAFFRPSLSSLYDPFLLKDMDKAVNRIQNAVKDQEKILVYGDYDVDGTTSVAMMYDFLGRYTSNLAYYIPDRYGEGYGISFKGIDYAKTHGFTLIIALDCGIKSIDKIEYAKSLSIDFIICDHHLPGEELPDAVAVLDPKRKDSGYPFKELSGCGVGFKLIQALEASGFATDGFDIYDYLDLLTVSIAADIVAIADENRIFCNFGINKLNANPRPGLKALGGVAGFKKNLNITNVVFGLAPRINAAGRIAHAHAAVELLLAKNEEDANALAVVLNDNNLSRKDFDSKITEEAINIIEESAGYATFKSTVLYKKEWHKGVIGIVASRCIEKYYRPTIILTESNGKATGSARSVDGFDLHEAVAACGHLLEQFGGHAHAAGLTLALENIEPFRSLFEETVAKNITEDQLIPKIPIDIEVDFEFITYKVFKIIQQMEPFGPANMKPVFMTKNVTEANYSRIVGNNHLKLLLKQKGKGTQMEAIGFGLGGYLEKILSKEPFAVCYTIEENTYNGFTSIQLNLKDLKFG